MTVHRWAAAVAAVLAVLFVAVVVMSFGGEERVVPTVAVRTAGQSGQQAAAPQLSPSELLANRARLQAEPAVESGARVRELMQAARADLTMNKGEVENAHALVAGWVEQVPAGTPALLQDPQYRSGRTTLPDPQAAVLLQPEGRDFRRLHNDEVRYGGGWLIFGVSLALALFLFARGRIDIAGRWGGERIERFSATERANHWMTATAFVILALTGVVLLYGKPLLLPLIGADAFGDLALAGVWAHMASAVPFVIGILLMAALWIRGNIPNRLDWEWLKRGGGFMRDDGVHPPAERFNAGQKIVFWGVFLGGLGMLATGILLMLPFYLVGYDGMQWAQLLHAALGLALLALIIGHIYIGTVGMVGAFDAMWNGRVDSTWAKEHHRLWYERITGRRSKAEDKPAG